MAVVSIKNKLRRGNLLAGNAAYIPTDYESIATVTLASDNPASIEFTNIPSIYSHLQLRFMVRYSVTSAGAYDPIFFRFNSDSGNNYARHYLSGNGSSAGAGANSSTSSGWAGMYNYAGDLSTFGIGIIDILDYKNTNKYKTVRGLGGGDANGSGLIWQTSSLWMNTNAITSIRIYDASVADAKFETYSQFALYGIKA